MRTLPVTATLAATAVLAVPAVVLAPQAMAQGAPQTVQLMKVDVVKVSTGYRASKVIGSSVVNEGGDTVGKVDEIIVGPDGKKIVPLGATKDSLKALPEFKYAS